MPDVASAVTQRLLYSWCNCTLCTACLELLRDCSTHVPALGYAKPRAGSSLGHKWRSPNRGAHDRLEGERERKEGGGNELAQVWGHCVSGTF